MGNLVTLVIGLLLAFVIGIAVGLSTNYTPQQVRYAETACMPARGLERFNRFEIHCVDGATYPMPPAEQPK